MVLEPLEGIQVRDIRIIPNPSIDIQGFQPLKFKSQMKYDQFEDDQAIHQIYLPEIEELLKKQYGATRVEFMRHKVKKLGFIPSV